MTNEDEQLLLADLCARLPYGVKIRFAGFSRREIHTLNSYHLNSTYLIKYRGLKPYLRPLSSMTEEEKVEYCDLQNKFLLSSQYPVTDGYALFDWLNKKMFDYRGLIEKGHALSTEEFNPYKD